jgi:hypothetical protein
MAYRRVPVPFDADARVFSVNRPRRTDGIHKFKNMEAKFLWSGPNPTLHEPKGGHLLAAIDPGRLLLWTEQRWAEWFTLERRSVFLRFFR